jgi:DNA-binding NarL/FixJ family response regulator
MDTAGAESPESGAMSTAHIRVVLCHEHAAVRLGLERLLDAVEGIEVVATAAEAQQGVEATTRLRPDVVLVDLSMPHVDGVTATRRITARAPRSSVLVLTAFPHPARIRDAMRAGASGYVLKEATPRQLVSSIRAAADRGTAGAGD